MNKIKKKYLVITNMINIKINNKILFKYKQNKRVYKVKLQKVAVQLNQQQMKNKHNKRKE